MGQLSIFPAVGRGRNRYEKDKAECRGQKARRPLLNGCRWLGGENRHGAVLVSHDGWAEYCVSFIRIDERRVRGLAERGPIKLGSQVKLHQVTQFNVGIVGLANKSNPCGKASVLQRGLD
jgi:hypothetical protein